MVPVAGSAYTYAYATLGELFAWIIGWDLVLEYAVGLGDGRARLVALLPGLHRPVRRCTCPHVVDQRAVRLRPGDRRSWSATGTMRRPAGRGHRRRCVTVILVKGIQESARFNAAMVIVKVAVVLFVIVVGAFYIDPSNWKPFAPLRL